MAFKSIFIIFLFTISSHCLSAPGNTPIPASGIFPYSLGIRIFFKGKKSKGAFFKPCTGTLVRPKALLTAGHCLFQPRMNIQPSMAICFEQQCNHSDQFQKRWIKSYSYRFNSQNDIGLILLARPISTRIKPKILSSQFYQTYFSGLKRSCRTKNKTPALIGVGISQAFIAPNKVKMEKIFISRILIGQKTALFLNFLKYFPQISIYRKHLHPNFFPTAPHPAVRFNSTCPGDSGSPVIGPGHVLLGIHVFGLEYNQTEVQDQKYLKKSLGPRKCRVKNDPYFSFAFHQKLTSELVEKLQFEAVKNGLKIVLKTPIRPLCFPQNVLMTSRRVLRKRLKKLIHFCEEIEKTCGKFYVIADQKVLSIKDIIKKKAQGRQLSLP